MQFKNHKHKYFEEMNTSSCDLKASAKDNVYIVFIQRLNLFKFSSSQNNNDESLLYFKRQITTKDDTRLKQLD